MPKSAKKEEVEAAYLSGLQKSLLEGYGKTLPQDYYAPTVMLSQAILKSMAHYERFAKQYDLTYNALMVLTCIRYAGDATSQSAISKLLWLPKQTVGSVLSGFKKKGYISESPSPHDARSKVVALTDEGKAFSDPIFERLQRIDAAAIQAESAENLETAVRSLDKYVAAFEKALSEVE